MRSVHRRRPEVQRDVGKENGWVGEVVWGRNSDSSYGEMRGFGSRTNGCREPNTAVNLARRAQRSSDFASSRRMHGRGTYSEKNVSDAEPGASNPSRWPEDLTIKVE